MSTLTLRRLIKPSAMPVWFVLAAMMVSGAHAACLAPPAVRTTVGQGYVGISWSADPSYAGQTPLAIQIELTAGGRRIGMFTSSDARGSRRHQLPAGFSGEICARARAKAHCADGSRGSSDWSSASCDQIAPQPTRTPVPTRTQPPQPTRTVAPTLPPVTVTRAMPPHPTRTQVPTRTQPPQPTRTVAPTLPPVTVTRTMPPHPTRTQPPLPTRTVAPTNPPVTRTVPPQPARTQPPQPSRTVAPTLPPVTATRTMPPQPTRTQVPTRTQPPSGSRTPQATRTARPMPTRPNGNTSIASPNRFVNAKATTRSTRSCNEPPPILRGQCGTSTVTLAWTWGSGANTATTFDIATLDPATGAYQTLVSGVTGNAYTMTSTTVFGGCFAIRANYPCTGTIATTPWSAPFCCNTTQPTATPTTAPTSTPCSAVAPPVVFGQCDPSNNTAILSWTFAFSNTNSVSFDIGVRNANGGISEIVTNIPGTTYTVTRTTTTGDWCYFVRAKFPCQGAITTSSWSAPFCCNTTQPTATPTPAACNEPAPVLTVNCQAMVGPVLNWTWGAGTSTHVTYDVGVRQVNGPVVVIASGLTATTYTVQILPAIYEPCFFVRANYPCGGQIATTVWSSVVCCNTMPPTATPTPASCDRPAPVVSAVCDASGTVLRWTWSATSTYVTYDVGARSVGGSIDVIASGLTATTYTIQVLPAIYESCFFVRANYPCGGAILTTVWSSAACCNNTQPTETPTPAACNEPPPILSGQCDPTTNVTYLIWLWANTPSAPATFDVGIRVANGGVSVIASGLTANTYTAAAPSPNFERCFFVRANYPCGGRIATTVWSAAFCCNNTQPTATPTAAPCPPEAPVFSSNSHCRATGSYSAELAWSSVPGALGYQIGATSSDSPNAIVVLLSVGPNDLHADVNIPTFAPVSDVCYYVRANVSCGVATVVLNTVWSRPLCCGGGPTATPTTAPCPPEAPAWRMNDTSCPDPADPNSVATLAWTAVSGAIEYEIGVEIPAMNTGVLVYQSVPGSQTHVTLSIPPIAGLPSPVEVCAYIQAKVMCGNRDAFTAWSAPVCCTLNFGGTPTPTPTPARHCALPAPAIDEAASICSPGNASYEFSLTWSAVTGAVEYSIGVLEPNILPNITEIASVPGSETTFTLRLPIDPATGTVAPCFYVRATYRCPMTNALEMTSWSRPFCCTHTAPTATPGPCPDRAPALSGRVDQGFLRLSWTDMSVLSAGVTYDVGQILPDGTISVVADNLTATVWMFDLRTALPVSDCFAVRAKYPCNGQISISPWSNDFCFCGQYTPTPTPTPDTGCGRAIPQFETRLCVCPSAADPTATLVWLPVPGAISYEVAYGRLNTTGQLLTVGTTIGDTTLIVRQIPVFEGCFFVRANVICGGAIVSTSWSSPFCCNGTVTPTPTPAPNRGPSIRSLTAYNNGVSEAQGGTLTFEAWVEDPDGALDVHSVELLIDHSPTNLFMAPSNPAQGYYTMNVVIPPGVPAGNYLLRFRPLDGSGNQGNVASYLLRIIPAAAPRSTGGTSNVQIRETYIRQDYARAGFQSSASTGFFLACRVVDTAGGAYVGPVHLTASGIPVGLALDDAGFLGDGTGDGIYSLRVNFDGRQVPASTALELGVSLQDGNGVDINDIQSTSWPFILEVY